MPLLNDFLIGADPEFVVIENGHLKRLVDVPRYAPWGIDHGGWVYEPHPKPELSVRAVIRNLKTSLNDFALSSPTGKWRAGAFLKTPERSVSLGGHVHIDKPTHTDRQVNALDRLAQHMEALDILPSVECKERRSVGGYGGYSDIRAEHGHFEYRTLGSWLYSQRVTKLCLLGTKLCVIDPEGIITALGAPTTASMPKLKKMFELYGGKDDDVNWVLSGGMLDKALTVKTDRNLCDVWKVEPKAEAPHWKELEARAKGTAGAVGTANVAIPNARQFVMTPTGYIFSWMPRQMMAPTQGWLINIDALIRQVGLQAAIAPAIAPTTYVYHGRLGETWDTARQLGRMTTIRHSVNNIRFSWHVSEAGAETIDWIGILRAHVLAGRQRVGLQIVEGRIAELFNEAPVHEANDDF